MKILGIDPGSARCGYGVIEIPEGSERPVWVAHGCIETDKLQRDCERLNRVFNDIISREKKE